MLVHRLRFLAPLPGIEPARQVDAYDFDDALFLRSILAPNRRFGWLKREAEHWLSYVRRARLVIAGNDYLAQRAREHARSVEVVPSCVDPERQPTREHKEREVVTIGWIGSRSRRSGPGVLPAIAALNEDRAGVRVVLVGADGPDLVAPGSSRDRGRFRTRGPGLVRHRDRALPDTEWTRGKCGYKLLQYFSAGVPAVASPVGVNTAMIGEEQERGLLATTLEEWRSALEQLVADTEARRAMGAEAMRFVEREYSYRRWAPELAGLLRQL